MTPDWTATQEPFSQSVAQLYVLETVEKVHNVPMCWRARQSEYKDLAKVLAQLYRNQMGRPSGGRCAPGEQ